ncbi:DgyrCDS7042 [Dimorphilus gyrociliatus]|uniref:DgyrCDS7042 n=1 Tax=Dimorphilus gyrociliatus TaxID=2664684 RepID=A0A7I8VRH1_9ANNE|nr:DgyrCDS7042 [Dimorphilus gyrociliatus]
MEENIINEVHDITEAIELYPPKNLFLVPINKITIIAILPAYLKKNRSISNWDIMEKLKQVIKPDYFIALKVIKSDFKYIQFEGEVNNKSLVRILISRMDGSCLKLNSLMEPVTIRVTEAKISFPLKNEWDSYFKDSKNMNEMKAGERPDTIHIKNLPISWFADISENDGKPCEKIVMECFNSFGSIRVIDIPILDKYRCKMQTSSAKRTARLLENPILFEVFIQFKEYVGFVRAMNCLKAKKLLYLDRHTGRKLTSLIMVNFDKTKHLSDKNIRKRNIERKRLQLKDEIHQKQNFNPFNSHQEYPITHEDIGEKEEGDEIQPQSEENLAMENRRNLLIHRKLQSIRLLGELLDRVKVRLVILFFLYYLLISF